MTSSEHQSPWRIAKIERIAQLTPRIKSFFVGVPALASQLASHRAGQHVDVRLTAPDGYAAQRSYSIASAPGADAIELIIEKLNDGEVSPYFHDVAEVGDSIEVRGPLGGHFVWQLADGGPLLLIGGGSGIAPLMAMVRAWAAKPTAGAPTDDMTHPPEVAMPALLICSARTAADLPFRDELLLLEAARPDFTFIAVTTREPPPRSTDLGRRLDAAAVANVLARWGHMPSHAFVCGANQFVEAVANGMVDAGVPANRIKTERYGGA
nr:FAD-binding oxidoreductase [uncultured Albidiferax sp.]